MAAIAMPLGMRIMTKYGKLISQGEICKRDTTTRKANLSFFFYERSNNHNEPDRIHTMSGFHCWQLKPGTRNMSSFFSGP